MRKAAGQILLGAAALVLLCIACRIAVFNQFCIYIPLPEDGRAEMPVRVEKQEVLRLGAPERSGRYLRFPVWPQAPGETQVLFGEETDDAVIVCVLRTDGLGTVYDLSSGNFTGDAAVLIAVTLFWLLVSAVMLRRFFQAKGPLFYDYGTIYHAGFSLFALASGLVMLSVTVSRLTRPGAYGMYSAYGAISGASVRYMLLTALPVILFALSMAVSNLALLRHEGRRPQNVLGLLVSALVIAGEALGWYLFSRDFMGSEWEGRIERTLQNTYATVFVYFQCMLTGAVICGVRAAKHWPDPDKRFIIIHGCWFRGDGTLPPLLRARADRALEFWRAQKEATGREAFFIPSGGQGANEPMPEAEAIRRYLLAQGVEDRLILPEDRSVNTYENLVFSMAVMQAVDPEGKAAFSTSSYHVFRSGVWARQAGLNAEGIGSRTKWWFWPNAFMRETAGLLLKRWKQELLFLVLLTVFFGCLSMVLW